MHVIKILSDKMIISMFCITNKRHIFQKLNSELFLQLNKISMDTVTIVLSNWMILNKYLLKWLMTNIWYKQYCTDMSYIHDNNYFNFFYLNFFLTEAES